MKSLFAVATVLVSMSAVASTNSGVATYKAGQMTCEQAKSALAQAGIATFQTGFPGGDQLAVSNPGLCNSSNAGGDGQFATGLFISTSDTSACQVGFSCQDNGGN